MTFARKVSTYQNGNGAFFLMTSGLRSVRDKTLTYFDEALETLPEPCDKLYKAVNLFTAQLRRVACEDKAFLTDSGLRFDMHALIGGQLIGDASHKLYLVYPEGNWVEISQGTPYHILGEGGYGKPVLDRTLKYSDPLRLALKVGCLPSIPPASAPRTWISPSMSCSTTRAAAIWPSTATRRRTWPTSRPGGRSICAVWSTNCPRSGSTPWPPS